MIFTCRICLFQIEYTEFHGNQFMLICANTVEQKTAKIRLPLIFTRFFGIMAFQRQKILLVRKAGAKARQFAIFAEDAMARQQQQQRIIVVGHADGARSARIAAGNGLLFVVCRLCVGDFCQLLPCAQLERSAQKEQGQLKNLAPPTKVFVQLGGGSRGPAAWPPVRLYLVHLYFGDFWDFLLALLLPLALLLLRGEQTRDVAAQFLRRNAGNVAKWRFAVVRSFAAFVEGSNAQRPNGPFVLLFAGMLLCRRLGALEIWRAKAETLRQ